MDEIKEFNNILQSFKIKASCVNFQSIDNYFYYDIRLQPNAKVKDIEKSITEISLMLKTAAKPSIKVLQQLGVVRLEFATPRTSKLNLFDYFTNKQVPKGDLMCLLGQSVDGSKVWMDLSQNPHMIISGTTGSGKSVLLHNIIANMFNYNDIQLFLLDPKNIEFSTYEKHIKKNLYVGYSYTESIKVLDSILELMESRYDAIRRGLDVKKLPYILLIIDEFADLIMQDKGELFYGKLCRLAQKCRAARINIILSTQRPSVNIINGSIKANFSARISCRMASQVDSKVVLDAAGAENLLGKGDALIRDNFRFLERFQVAYTTAEEVCKIFGE
jgi:S-DNA-T family DNA segregation ATPase FtsK/SpoIIIE